jgi:hypothetical protein
VPGASLDEPECGSRPMEWDPSEKPRCKKTIG